MANLPPTGPESPPVSEAPHLSLILPAYNSSAYIEENTRLVVSSLEAIGWPFEVLVVCDGAADDTAERARAIADPRVQVHSYAQNRGKGYAIRYGMDRARGRLIGWLDADLDIHPQAIVDAARYFEQYDVDAVIGSKRHPDSVVDYPLMRSILSIGYFMLVRVLLRVRVSDTQTGAKLFRREMLDTVAPLLLIKRYAFDLEVLAVAAGFGFDRVQEMPINLQYRSFTGTGIDRRAVRSMFVDTIAIAYRIHVRHWYVRQFAQLQRERTAGASGEATPHTLEMGAVEERLISSRR